MRRVAHAVAVVQLPVYVINLDRRPDRRERVFRNLDQIGVEAERVSAIDGDMIEPNNRKCSLLSVREEACLESHCKALRSFLVTQREAALILEDDVSLSFALPEVLSSPFWWPSRTEIIKLDTYPESDKLRLLSRCIGHTPDGRELRRIEWAHACASAYLISQRGAAIVLEARRRVQMTTDSLLFHMIGSPVARRLRPVLVNPALVTHPLKSDDSDIGPHRTLRRATGRAGRIVFKGRALARRLSGQASYVSTNYANLLRR